MVKISFNEEFNKFDLKRELRNAGFENFIVDNIVERVNEKKVDGWTIKQARQEAVREIEILLRSTKHSFDNFRLKSGITTEEVTNSPF
ncbi:MAG: hypothetical protein ABSB10_00930 [Candidatus Bathyarchaeia archaeon]